MSRMPVRAVSIVGLAMFGLLEVVDTADAQVFRRRWRNAYVSASPGEFQAGVPGAQFQATPYGAQAGAGVQGAGAQFQATPYGAQAGAQAGTQGAQAGVQAGTQPGVQAGVQGQFQPGQPGQPFQAQAGAAAQANRLSSLMTTQITLANGAQGGRIVDFILSPEGCVNFAVVDNNQRLVLVPYNAIRFDAQQRSGQIQITTERFNQAPTFTQQQWGMVADPQFMQQVSTFYGIEVQQRNQGQGQPTKTKININGNQQTPPDR